MAIAIYNWIKDNEEDDNEDIQPPTDEEIYIIIQELMRRGARGNRSITPEERASGSNIGSLRRGASRNRTVVKKFDEKDKNMTQFLIERKPLHLVLLNIVNLQSIKTKKERNDI